MNIINLNKNNNVILIDCSYYIFHRYFATYRWFSFQKINVEIEDIVDNNIFITAFYKHINNDIKKICKNWKTTIDNIVLCNDCMRSDIWRNDLYDKYKSTRTQKNNFNKKIFNIFAEYIKTLNIKSLSSERLEGDDIVYIAHKTIKPYVNKNIIIITNDNDFLQLVDSNVNIYNMQFKELKKRGFNDPNIDLQFKAIYGDRSDNIPKISSVITKDKAIYIANLNEKDRLKYLEESNLLDKYYFNLSLVSFDKIPNEYIDIFNNSIRINLYE